MNQAFMLAKNKNGDIDNWGLTKAGETSTPTDEEIINGNNTRNKFWEIMSPYLKIVSRCKAGTNECTAYNRYSLDGTSFSTFTPYIILSDGIYIVGTTVLSSSCSEYRGTSRQLQNVCGEIFVDVNGSKPPNSTGKDVFLFYYTKYGFMPMGTDSDSTNSFENSCNINTKSKLNGYGCTAWVIYNENMDYLRCNDLSWNGKIKCN